MALLDFGKPGTPFTLQPNPDESFRGFVLRLAERNFLDTPVVLLRHVKGNGNWDFAHHQIAALALFAGCDVRALADIYVGMRRGPYGQVRYEGLPFRLTKPYFWVLNQTRVCPMCLDEAAYCRRIWDIALLSACPVHKVCLIEQCPHCGKALKWLRPGPGRCGCGFSLKKAKLVAAVPEALLWAELIGFTTGSVATVNSELYPVSLVDQLASLSVDGLLKCLWFFGKYMTPGMLYTGHAKRQPSVEEAGALCVAASSVLVGWPDHFIRAIEAQGHSIPKEMRAGRVQRLFGALHEYVVAEMQADELAFVPAAYERALRSFWKKQNWTFARLPDLTRHQLEFDFEAGQDDQ